MTLLDANSGLAFEVRIGKRWHKVIAWDEEGWPLILSVTRCKLEDASTATEIRLCALGGTRPVTGRPRFVR